MRSTISQCLKISHKMSHFFVILNETFSVIIKHHVFEDEIEDVISHKNIWYLFVKFLVNNCSGVFLVVPTFTGGI